MCMGAPLTPSMKAVPQSECTHKSMGWIPALTDGGMNGRGAMITVALRLTADNLLHELITYGEGLVKPLNKKQIPSGLYHRPWSKFHR